MKSQVVSVNQMQKLKELSDMYGVPIRTDEASMALWNFNIGNDGTNVYDVLMENKCFPENEDWAQYGNKNCCVWLLFKTPVFTLQDIMKLLPDKIARAGSDYCLFIDKCGEDYFFAYSFINDKLKEIKSTDILQAAYEMLMWAIKNADDYCEND